MGYVVLFVISTVFHAMRSSQLDLNTTTTTTTTTTPTTTDFFTTLEAHQCFIGSKCSKTKHCCPSGIDEESNGISCSGRMHQPRHQHSPPRGRDPHRNRKKVRGNTKKRKKNNKICCINDGFIGCSYDSDCCEDTKCYDGVCQSKNNASILSSCSIGSSCRKTDDCCFGYTNERIVGVTCAWKNDDWYKRNTQGKACCIKTGYDGCIENTDCCTPHVQCMVGSCVAAAKGNAGFAALVLPTGDNSMEFGMDSRGISVPMAVLLIGMMICLIMLCATCCLYVIVSKRIEQERDELSTAGVPSIMDWESIRTEIRLKPIQEATAEEEEDSDSEYKPKDALFCFCSEPKSYAD